MPETSTHEQDLSDFIRQCYELFGSKVKIKLMRNSKGYTWEITVKDDDMNMALLIMRQIKNKLEKLTTMEEVKDAESTNRKLESD
jgi:hypothetical protein